MDHIILSDPEYLKDLIRILESIFSVPTIAKQPKYLIEIGCKDGFFLKHAYNYVKTQTNRGMKLGDYPLEVIALIPDNWWKEEVHNQLLDIPNKVAAVSDMQASNILKVLGQLGIEDPEHALYVEIFSDKKQIDFEDYKALHSLHGMIQLQAHSLEYSVMEEHREEISKLLPTFPLQQTPEIYLMDAAKVGWFSGWSYSHQYPASRLYARSTLDYFEEKKYHIRKAEKKDIEAMLHIEKSCLAEPLRFHKEILEKLITMYSAGQLVFEDQDGIKGFATSIRLMNIEILNNAEENSLLEFHHPKGPIILSIGLYMLPEKQVLEEKLFEFFLQKSFVTSGIAQVVKVARCSNYPGKESGPLESYVEALKLEKGVGDKAIKMLMGHGGEIVKILQKYRPQDDIHSGCGVLVAFVRGIRAVASPQAVMHPITAYEEEINEESIAKSIDKLIESFLALKGNRKKEVYKRTDTFTEMGLDSIQLLELRAIFSKEFSIDLPINFFIIHETPAAIIAFFVDTMLQPFREWLFEKRWIPAPKPEIEKLIPGRTWIVVVDPKNEFGSQLVGYLQGNRQNCIVVAAGESFKKTDNSHFSVRPTVEEDYKQLFSMIPNLENVDGIIYLWGIEESFNDIDEPPLELIEGFHRFSLEGLILFMNTFVSLKLDNSPKLWVVTQTIPLDGRLASLAEWPLNALCKVLRDEYPKYLCRYIAIDPKEDIFESCATLFDEICSRTQEPQVAFRNRHRLVLRMFHCEAEVLKIPKFSAKASYLIAGGFRPLGMLLARWYISHGAKYIILLDEIEISPETAEEIEDLKKLGAQIIQEKKDLSSESDLKEMFERINKEMPPLQGVIHAAGIVDNDLILHMNWERLMSVHRLKISLSWHLHRLTEPFDLDHFVMFGSCLPDVAPFGKANHATGNCFLDVLAYYRKKRALPALTIDWGPWELSRMLVKKLVESKPSDRLKLLKIEDGLRAFDQFFNISKPQITAVIMEWPVLFRSIGEENPLFDEIAVEMGYKRANILQLYMEAFPDERFDMIKNYVADTLMRVLKLRSSRALDYHREFVHLGLEPSNFKTLKNHIQFDLHEILQLPFNFVEINPTIEKLSRALCIALDEAIKTEPQMKMEVPIAMIGIKGNKVELQILNDKLAKIELKDVSDANNAKIILVEPVKS